MELNFNTNSSFVMCSTRQLREVYGHNKANLSKVSACGVTFFFVLRMCAL